jgi:predicted phage terminase large subunit-like protein
MAPGPEYELIQDAAAWAALIQQARGSLVDYRHIFLATGADECQPAPFHYDWSDILIFDTNNYAIEAFRESAKTQYILRAFPFYALTFPDPSRDYLVIIKNNTPLAQAKLKEIEHELDSNPALAANVVKIRERSGSALSVDVRRPKIQAPAPGADQAANDPSRKHQSAATGAKNPGPGPANPAEGGGGREGRSVYPYKTLDKNIGDISKGGVSRGTEIVNIRIEAYGKGSSIRGLANIDRRPKIVMIDDPQDLEDSKSDAVLASDWEWFLSDVMFLGQTSRIFMIANNLGERCIIERVAANAKELGFKFSRQAIINEETGDPTWPSKYTAESIQEEKENYRKLGKVDIWLRERMCIAMADETRIFQKKDFRYYNPRLAESKAGECNRFMLVDPATSTSVTSDYRAVMVVGVDIDNQWFVFDCSYGRYDSAELINEIFRLAIAWDVREVGIEEGALKSAIQPFIEPEMKRRNQFFTILPMKHGGRRKEERIRMLQPRFKNGAVFFPDDAPWLAELESELLSFTMDGMKGLHDDLIDALAYTEQIARVPFRTGKAANSKQFANLPRQTDMTTTI